MTGATLWSAGPWSVHAGSTLSEPPSVRQVGTGAFVAFANLDLDERMTPEELQANAALMAAAPELYDALAALVQTIDALGAVRIPKMAAARAALAKARGETP